VAPSLGVDLSPIDVRDALAAVDLLPQLPRDATCHDTRVPVDHPCPHCGCRMVIIEAFAAHSTPRHRPSQPAPIISINTS